jgi:cation:H+ antiporter
MIPLIAIFLVGLLILLFSTQQFVKLAQSLSLSIKISPLIVGTTIVALGTSLPELVVSVVAAIKGDSGLAIGNIIGSNIVNILMVLPVGILLGKLRIGTVKTQYNVLLVLFTTGLFILALLSSLSNPLIGAVLIACALLVTVFQYKFAIAGRSKEDQARYLDVEEKPVGPVAIIFVLVTLIAVVLGGLMIVYSVEAIASLTSLSTTFLGLTLAAISTSLPELLTTIFSQKGNQEKITLGNILGSNIYNLLLVGGISLLFSNIETISIIESIWLITTAVLLVFLIRYYKGKTPPRWIAFILLILLIVYIFSIQ